MSRIIKRTALALAAATLLAGAANAGGFNRGSANLEGLYGDNFGMTSGATFVAPSRRYSAGATNSLGQVSTSDDSFSDSFIVPYASLGGRLIGGLNCVGSYSQPYGANSSYTDPALRFELSAQNLEADELGLTCSYGFDAGAGRAYIIGGVFHEAIEYNQARDFTTSPFAPLVGGQESFINVTSEDTGFRLGFGYEIEEIALRGQIMYRSATEHSVVGEYTNTPFAALAAASAFRRALGAGATVAQADGIAAGAAALYGGTYAGNGIAFGGASRATATGFAELPQSVEATFRTGVAPGWLAFGSVKWTDWSVLQEIFLFEDIAGQAFTSAEFFFTDGWTVSAGMAHQFNDAVTASAALTWDKGVTSGFDTLSDTWTVSGGVRLSENNVNLSLGGAAVYFTSADKTRGNVIATSPGEWGYALSASASVKF